MARKILEGVTIRAALVQIGPHRIDPARWDWDLTEDEPLLVPGRRKWSRCGRPISTASARRGSSVGAVVEVIAEGVPAGWGAPIYGKLDAELAAALMSINAVKGVEIGAGFAAAALTGEENADEMAHGRRRAGVHRPTTPAACWAASPPASRWWRARRSSPPPRS